MSEPDDHDLVTRARAGSKEALGELFSRHWRPAWRAAYGLTGERATADDVAQDAFERAIRNLHRFDGRRPFGAWLHRIVVNRAHDVMRRERRLTALEGHAEEAADAGQHAAAERAEVREAIGRLDFDRRAVVILHYWLGHPLTSVAEILDVPVGTVHSRMSRALADLRQRLEVGDAGQPR